MSFAHFSIWLLGHLFSDFEQLFTYIMKISFSSVMLQIYSANLSTDFWIYGISFPQREF